MRYNLEAEGYSVDTVGDGEAALSLLLEEQRPYDAIVLDVMLPGKDGFAGGRGTTGRGPLCALLMLTARGRPEDVLKGFESGADDYLPKPFELSVLMARIHALLRRRDWLRLRHTEDEVRAAAIEAQNEVYKFDGKTIDLENLELRTDKQTVRLTLMEAQLLRYLIKHEGEIVKRKAMLEEVWGLHEDTDTRAIDNFIVRLRRYIEDEPSRPEHLLTVRGLGYRFVRGSGD